jgi:DNA-binding beta-propeller fold protein YncE
MLSGGRIRRRARRRHGAGWTALGVLGASIALAVSACAGTGPQAASTSATTPSPASTPMPPAATATPVLLTPTATTPAPASTSLGPAATPQASDLMAYVALGDGEVVPVDVTAGTARTPILVGVSPTAIAIAPDGRTAYVTDGVTGTLTPLDLATATAGTAIPVTSAGGLSSIAITPSGTTAYVTADPTSGVSGSVIPITLASGAVGTPIPVGAGPVAIAITPDGRTAYVVNAGDGTVTPIELATGTAGNPVSVGVDPVAIAVAANGSTAYVLGGSGLGQVTPITLFANPAQDVVGTPIAVQTGAPTGIAIAPTGAAAYVTGITGAAQLVLTGGAGSGTTSAGDYSAVAISPDGSTALLGYAGSAGSAWNAVPVRPLTATPGAAIPLDAEPVSIAFLPSS